MIDKWTLMQLVSNPVIIPVDMLVILVQIRGRVRVEVRVRVL